MYEYSDSLSFRWMPVSAIASKIVLPSVLMALHFGYFSCMCFRVSWLGHIAIWLSLKTIRRDISSGNGSKKLLEVSPLSKCITRAPTFRPANAASTVESVSPCTNTSISPASVDNVFSCLTTPIYACGSQAIKEKIVACSFAGIAGICFEFTPNSSSKSCMVSKCWPVIRRVHARLLFSHSTITGATLMSCARVPITNTKCF